MNSQVLAQTRMNSLLQLSKAINDAQAEREQAIAQALLQAKADKLEAVAEARQEQLIKVWSMVVMVVVVIVVVVIMMMMVVVVISGRSREGALGACTPP